MISSRCLNIIRSLMTSLCIRVSIAEILKASDMYNLSSHYDKSFNFYDIGNMELKSKSLEDLTFYYEDERNAMIAIANPENDEDYEDFYEEINVGLNSVPSIDVIFFGSNFDFTRLDAETMLHILQHTNKNKLPNARALLAWDILTDGRTAAFLQAREYLALGTLLSVIPEDDLYLVNFGNPQVLDFFSDHYIKLSKRKFGILTAAFRRYYGNSWYTSAETINKLGYLICGFPSFDLQKIKPEIFWEISTNVFSKLDKCSLNQTETIYNTATNPDGFGGPYTWGSLEIEKLGVLFNYIPVREISYLHLEAITGIKPEVMKVMDKRKLKYFSKQQVFRMLRETRRIYILRMQLLTSYSIDLFQDSQSK